MDCPYRKHPIVTPVGECHAEQAFCSDKCGMRFVHGEPISEPVPRSLWSLNILLGTKFEYAHRADDFAEEYFIGPFAVSNDILHNWLLYFNHKQYRYIHIADLNRMASIRKLILNGDIQTALSFLLADLLDSVGTVISRGNWAFRPLRIHCSDSDGWS